LNKEGEKSRRRKKLGREESLRTKESNKSQSTRASMPLSLNDRKWAMN